MDLGNEGIMASVADQKVAGAISAQMKPAADLGLSSTPSFVAGAASVAGYPGPVTLSRIVKALGRCGKIVCG